ncbi:MAG: tocopherol O-methyltransferase [Verrucomicrobiota bacterium]
MAASPQFHVDIGEIRKHYDRLSVLYRMLWGEHLHHGYWEDNESIARAQIQLMERLAEKADIPRGAQVLDIGCGLGGSAFWLAEQYDCRVTGLTISPVQARMATKKAKAKGLSDQLQFVVADANSWQPQRESVDVIWIMESSEHFRDKKRFFERCASALKPAGVLAVCAWLRGERPIRGDEQELVATIGKAMLSASLDTLSQYVAWMREANLEVETAKDITGNIAPTWEHCSRMAQRLPVRWLVHLADAPTRRFVKSFPLMTQAYVTGAMAFGLFVARKPASAG